MRPCNLLESTAELLHALECVHSEVTNTSNQQENLCIIHKFASVTSSMFYVLYAHDRLFFQGLRVVPSTKVTKATSAHAASANETFHVPLPKPVAALWGAKSPALYEGYMKNNTFYVVDIWMYTGAPVIMDFQSRRELLVREFGKLSGLADMSGVHIDVNLRWEIASIADSLSELTIDVKSDLMQVIPNTYNMWAKKTVCVKEKKRVRGYSTSTSEAAADVTVKVTKHVDFPEIYVFDHENKQNVLYVCGLKMSQTLRQMFNTNSLEDGVNLTVRWSSRRNKWTPVLQI